MEIYSRCFPLPWNEDVGHHYAATDLFEKPDHRYAYFFPLLPICLIDCADDDTVQGIKIPPEQGDIRVEHWSVEKLPRNTQDRKAYGLYFAHADTVHESANPVAHVVT